MNKTVHTGSAVGTDATTARSAFAAEEAGPIQTITDPLELFIWLFQQVEAEEPRIPVRSCITVARHELFEAIRHGRPPQAYMYWHRILREGISWGMQADETARRCSLGMLTFIGHIGQFTHRNPGAAVPIAIAIEMLACIAKTGGLLMGGFSEEGAWVSTTPESVEKLGVQFEVTLYRNAGKLDYWDWDGHYGIR